MKKNYKELKEYFLVTIIFAWFSWLLSMYIAIKSHTYIPLDDRIFTIMKNGFNNFNQFIASFLFFIGTLGPIVGAMFLKYKYKKPILFKFNKLDYNNLIIAVILPLILMLLSLFTPFLLNHVRFEYMIPFIFIVMLLIIQLLFSTFTIIGWLLYFYPILEKKYKLIKSSYILGLFWGLSMLPIIIYVSYQYNALYIFFNVITLIATTVPLALILNWLYKKTSNVALVIFTYAWFKTVYMTFMIIVMETVLPTMFVILGLWLINFYIIEKNKKYL